MLTIISIKRKEKFWKNSMFYVKGISKWTTIENRFQKREPFHIAVKHFHCLTICESDFCQSSNMRSKIVSGGLVTVSLALHGFYVRQFMNVIIRLNWHGNWGSKNVGRRFITNFAVAAEWRWLLSTLIFHWIRGATA